MTSSLHLSRIRLKSLRGETLASIAPLLIPSDPKQRPGHAHRVLWLLFQDIPGATRDFLWRDEGNGRFMILSRRPPSDPHGLFELQTKPFEPELEPGDRLAFVMRVNPTTASKPAAHQEADRAESGKRLRGKRVDVVMNSLHAVPRTEWDAQTSKAIAGRAIQRDAIITRTCEAWLSSQLIKAGANLVADSFTATNYMQIPLDRRSGQARRAAGSKGRPGGFSMLDMTGTLTVTDPAAFIGRLALGFGSAKAFGCGLMLIRRAR